MEKSKCSEVDQGKNTSENVCKMSDPLQSDDQKSWTWTKVTHLIGWCASSVYLFYSLYCVSIQYRSTLDDSLFAPSYLPYFKEKDTADWEWYFWLNWFPIFGPFFCGHIVIGQLTHKYGRLRKYCFIVYSLGVLCWILEWKPVLIIAMECVLMYLAACTASSVTVWAMGTIFIFLLNIPWSLSIIAYLIGDDPQRRRFDLFILTAAMSHLRFTSFALEKAWSRSTEKKNKGARKSHRSKANPDTDQNTASNNSQEDNADMDGSNIIGYSIIDMLVYVFYLPLFYTGPLLSYELFMSDFNRPYRSLSFDHLKQIAKDLIRVIFWVFVIELFLHTFCFCSLMHAANALENMPLWGLGAVGYVNGQFFMMKYVVFYGLPGVIAKFDQIYAPRGPICISHVYKYSELWRYFDRGLYSFIKRYIYVPLGGSQAGLFFQLLASVICFSFIYIWHGAEMFIFVWAALNLGGIMLENIGRRCERTSYVKQIAETLPFPLWSTIRTLLIVPVFASSILAVFIFFGGTGVGWIYFNRMIVNGWPVPLLTITAVLFCFIRSSDALRGYCVHRVKVKRD